MIVEKRAFVRFFELNYVHLIDLGFLIPCDWLVLLGTSEIMTVKMPYN